jgi:hypothetical protein
MVQMKKQTRKIKKTPAHMLAKSTFDGFVIATEKTASSILINDYLP